MKPLIRQHRAVAWLGGGQVPTAPWLGLAVDAQSRLFVSETRPPQVTVFSSYGEPVIALGTKLMKRPAGLAIDDLRGRLYVADILLRKVLVYSLRTLHLVSQIGGPLPPAEAAADAPFEPAILLVSPEGNLFVLDTLQCRIVVFNEEGEFVRTFCEAGERAEESGDPDDIGSDARRADARESAGGKVVLTANSERLPSPGNLGVAPVRFIPPIPAAIERESGALAVGHSVLPGDLFETFPPPPRGHEEGRFCAGEQGSR